jgi:hypothetical protein
MDLSEAAAWQELSSTELEEIHWLTTDEIGQSDWFFRQGVDYVLSHPFRTLRSSIAKIRAGFSWKLSPSRDSLRNLLYSFSYGPHLVFGTVGIFLTRKRWRELSLIYLLYVAFMVGTAVFWANSSHRSYLDLYLIMFSAHSIRALYARRARWLKQTRLLFQRRTGNMC